MSPKQRDPRTYIEQKPLPIKSDLGKHILARSETHYNCAEPTRETVFRQNFARRQKQRKEQGYNSVDYEPYKLLGEPLYLNEKKLILHALGQLDENNEESSSSSDEEEEKKKDKEKKDGVAGLEEVPVPKKFVLTRRSNKNQKSLSKEVASGRKMVQSAKLGHGVFSIIRQKDEERRNAKEIERLKREEQRRREWQPPAQDSSDEYETDDDLNEDIEINNFFLTQGQSSTKSVAFSPVSEQGISDGKENTVRKSFSSMTSVSRTPDTVRSINKRRKSKKKKPSEPPRPYTPYSTNINTAMHVGDPPDKKSIFRQLCALNWLLEAMITEPPGAMMPISLCWNIKYKELEQNTFCKTTVRKLNKDRSLDSRWTSFVTSPGIGNFRTRMIGKFGTNLTAAAQFHRGPRRISSGQIHPGKALSVVSSSSPTSNMFATGTQQDDTLKEDRALNRSLLDIREGSAATKLDDNDPETASRIDKHDRSASMVSNRSSHGTQEKNSLKNQVLSRQKLEERNKIMNKKTPDIQIQKWVVSTNRKLRSTSAPGTKTQEFKMLFPSKKHIYLPVDLRAKFGDVAEDKDLMLHDQLEAMEKKRLWRSEEKFKAISTKLHISTQLDELKKAGQDPEETAEEKKKKKKAESECKWFYALKKNLSQDIINDMQCSAIVDKLESIGNIQSRKITPQKFLGILSGLRHWEICSPDISAAIEFIRENVVSMSIEDFENWFQSEMPGIVRSQSAPPV
ncbi:coiled-coil domain-containing protein 60-like isoform X2 [Anneissia japonica]|uniref:coiled-coil domain-containing protein 60-like isoform X2 n=1 Tax=Anneissia japonica TaxID=1529436 RepID=UPI001425661E|nr:coiled-coil domain-containing protein 60-like isoform X2 [Anneissia japonica]